MVRKLFSNKLILIILSVIFISTCIVTSAASSSDMEATLFDSSLYGGGTGTALTESGSTVSGWLYDTSKFLQIVPNVPADGNTYTVTIKLPQELYAVTSSLSTPVGYSNVSFTKNESIKANNNKVTYALNDYSGTFTYTLEAGVTSGTIQMELRYDRLLWDKLANSKLTPNGVNPIEVILTNQTTGQVLKTLYVKEATSSSAFGISSIYRHTVVNGTAYTDATINLLTKDTARYYSTIITSNQVAEYSFYKTLKYEIQLPAYTDSSSVKHYQTVDFSKISSGDYIPDVDQSDLANGKIVLTYHDIYFSTSNNLFNLYLSFPNELKSSSATSFSFTGGKNNLFVSDKNGNMKSLKTGDMPSFNYKTQADENVTLSSGNNTTTITNRPDTAVTVFGRFMLRNSGSADSEQKNFKVTFDSNNTNLIKVTTYRVPAGNKTQTINLKYTLVDENGQRVYLNSSGQRVLETDEGAIGEWTYNMNNSYYNRATATNQSITFYRNNLPANQRSYYFKTIEYSLTSLQASTYFYANSGSNALTSGGNFAGYVSDAAVHNNKVNSVMEMTSDSFAKKTVTAVTTLSSVSSNAYGIDTMRVDKTSVSAGNSVNITGRVSVGSYPYGTSTWLRDIVLGIVLPEGVSINEQSINAYTKNSSNKISPTSVTNSATSDGKVLWRLYFPSDVVVGYATENGSSTLSDGAYFNFSMQLDTAYYLNQQTVNLVDSTFAASTSQTNSASGAWAWARTVDSYDINENGNKTEGIGRVRTNQTASFEITPQTATFDIHDVVSVSSNGSISEDSNFGNLYSKDDVLTYKLKLDCLSGGSAEDFVYFVPIPKTTSGTDEYLIKNEKPFDLVLTEAATMTGSDIYSVEYAFDSNINYNKALTGNITWYTANDISNNSSLNIKDVTMIRLKPKIDVIPNGSSTILSFKLKYGSSTYNEDAGMAYIFHSAGYYKYTNNGRELSGNFNTEGVTAYINYEKTLDDITLTAAKDRVVQSGNYNELTVGSDLPEFKNTQNYTITKVETYNVILKSKSYVLSNLDMNSNDSNRTFAVTASVNGSSEKDIEENVSLGSGSTNSLFTYKLYNANVFTDNYTSRYVVLTIATDSGVTLKQKIIINRELSGASDPVSSITAGEQYNLFDDVNNSVTISQDSSATIQFVTSYIPSLYGEHKIKLSKALPKGTTLKLSNSTDLNNISYWYYVTSGSETEISFNDFIKMGTTSDKSYTYYTSTDNVDEKLLLIISFSNVSPSDLTADSYDVSLDIKGNGVDDLNSSLDLITVEKRQFNLNVSSSVNVKSDFNCSYSMTAPNGEESKYDGRKLSLVVYNTNLPVDSSMSLDGVKYYMNAEGKFILPLDDVTGSNKSVTLNLSSSLFTENTYNLTFELWASATSNANSPLMGEKLLSKSVVFNNVKTVMPSLKIIGMNSQLLKSDNLNKNLSLSFNTADVNGCTATIELQQKIGNGYQKLTNRLASVNGSTSHDTGAYPINVTSGSNTVNLVLSSQTETGTYRYVIKIKKGDQVLLEVPYNFIVLN